MLDELISELNTRGADFVKIVDVYHCITCLKCLINCPWTQGYLKKCLNGKENKK